MPEQRLKSGVFWRNPTIGVEDWGGFPLNAHFYPDGEERVVIKDGERLGYEVGYSTPAFKDNCPGVWVVVYEYECEGAIYISRSRIE